MLNRRQVRIKVFHALYAFFQGESDDRARFDNSLKKSFDDLYDLFLLELSLLTLIRQTAANRSEVETKKYFPSDLKLKQYNYLKENGVLLKLEENLFLQDKLRSLPYSLEGEEGLLDAIMDEIIASDLLTEEHIAETSFAKESKLILEIFNTVIAGNTELHQVIIERNIHWADDIPLVNTSVQRFLKGIRKGDDEYAQLPVKISDDEIVPFGRSLFIKTLNNSDSISELVDKQVKNWELDRIAIIDLILIKMAVTEFMEFNEIPVKVTINEYIEICKDYSTPKSKVFVNGVLDKIQKLLKEEGKLTKSGRGLL
jgi:N utilization substance protein B